MEPAVAWLLLSAHSSGIVHLSHPNKELGSSAVHPPSPGMDVALMLPTQARQPSFFLSLQGLWQVLYTVGNCIPSVLLCFWVKKRRDAHQSNGACSQRAKTKKTSTFALTNRTLGMFEGRHTSPFLPVWFLEQKEWMTATAVHAVRLFLQLITADNYVHPATDPVLSPSLPLLSHQHNNTEKYHAETRRESGVKAAVCVDASPSSAPAFAALVPAVNQYKRGGKNRIGGESLSEEMQFKFQRLHFTGEMSGWITLPVIYLGFRPRLGNQWIHY